MWIPWGWPFIINITIITINRQHTSRCTNTFRIRIHQLLRWIRWWKCHFTDCHFLLFSKIEYECPEISLLSNVSLNRQFEDTVVLFVFNFNLRNSRILFAVRTCTVMRALCVVRQGYFRLGICFLFLVFFVCFYFPFSSSSWVCAPFTLRSCRRSHKTIIIIYIWTEEEKKQLKSKHFRPNNKWLTIFCVLQQIKPKIIYIHIRTRTRTHSNISFFFIIQQIVFIWLLVAHTAMSGVGLVWCIYFSLYIIFTTMRQWVAESSMAKNRTMLLFF